MASLQSRPWSLNPGEWLSLVEKLQLEERWAQERKRAYELGANSQIEQQGSQGKKMSQGGSGQLCKYMSCGHSAVLLIMCLKATRRRRCIVSEQTLHHLQDITHNIWTYMIHAQCYQRGSILFTSTDKVILLSIKIYLLLMGFLGCSDGKESACNAGDPGSIPGLERPPEEGNSNPLQYSCLENFMDREAWRATVHRVTVRHD